VAAGCFFLQSSWVAADMTAVVLLVEAVLILADLVEVILVEAEPVGIFKLCVSLRKIKFN
jgi:hypothetical protein